MELDKFGSKEFSDKALHDFALVDRALEGDQSAFDEQLAVSYAFENGAQCGRHLAFDHGSFCQGVQKLR